MHTQNCLKWRYATKKFDTSKELTTEDLNYVVEAGNLAPTSYGLQPFKIVVVTNNEIKKSLVSHAYQQEQVGENGALIVLAVRTDIDADFISKYTQNIEVTRGLPTGAVSGFKDMMVNQLASLTPEARTTWAQKQAYLALGVMMVAAAEKGIDSCPMEGFNSNAFNEVLGLTAHNLHATLVLPLGFRSTEDKTQEYKKVRSDINDITLKIE
jgi:nitroreductase